MPVGPPILGEVVRLFIGLSDESWLFLKALKWQTEVAWFSTVEAQLSLIQWSHSWHPRVLALLGDKNRKIGQYERRTSS